MKKILGDLQDLPANKYSQFSHNFWNWAELAVLVSWQILNGSKDFLHTFSMALYHKWDVKNGFTFVLQFFSLISDGLGGVRKADSLINKGALEQSSIPNSPIALLAGLPETVRLMSLKIVLYFPTNLRTKHDVENWGKCIGAPTGILKLCHQHQHL